jgi:hypothetical protein
VAASAQLLVTADGQIVVAGYSRRRVTGVLVGALALAAVRAATATAALIPVSRSSDEELQCFARSKVSKGVISPEA